MEVRCFEIYNNVNKVAAHHPMLSDSSIIVNNRILGFQKIKFLREFSMALFGSILNFRHSCWAGFLIF